MSIQSCLDAINLVGKTVKPAHGTERWARANGKPRIGKVINFHIPDVDHPYVVVEYGTDVDFPYPFELDVITH